MGIRLVWKAEHGSETAYLGKVSIGSIGQLSADPGTWWYKVDGVYVKWIAKGFGHVRSKAAARRGVVRAFEAWAERAELRAAPAQGQAGPRVAALVEAAKAIVQNDQQAMDILRKAEVPIDPRQYRLSEALRAALAAMGEDARA